MVFMKKILVLLLTGAMLLSAAPTALASFGDNSSSVEDNITDETVAVAFNDFENATGFPEHSVFSITDTGEEKHGKAFKVAPFAQWSAINNGNYGTYEWNGKTNNTLNEPVEAGKNYILAFDYKNFNITSEGHGGNACSFAPQLPAFSAGKDSSGNEEYRLLLPIVEKWTVFRRAFHVDAAATMKFKVNTLGSNIGTYIDNYLLQEAVSLKVTGFTDAKPQILSGVLVNDFTPIGEALSFKAPEGYHYSSVLMNGKEIAEENGCYTVPAVLGDIVITAVRDFSNFYNTYLVKDGTKLYTTPQSVGSFRKAAGEELYEGITVYSKDGALKSDDSAIKPGDKVKLATSGTTAVTLTVYYLNDIDENGIYNVSDLVALTDSALKSEYLNTNDLNRDGRITVTDMIKLRSIIMSENSVTINTERLNAMKTQIAETAREYGMSDKTFQNSVYSVGNRTRVANTMKKALRGEKITVAAVGGSITRGDGASDSTKCYAYRVYEWWNTMFPGQVTFVNAGISGTNSIFGSYRIETDVLKYDPDFLIVEWAVNDGNGGGTFLNAHEAVIRKALLFSDIAVMQLFNTSISQGMNCGQDNQSKVGAFYGLPGISQRDAFYNKTFKKADGTVLEFYNADVPEKSLTCDGTHPNDTGYTMTALLINSYLTSVYEDLEGISNDILGVPSGYYNEMAKYYMNPDLFDPGETDKDGRVGVQDFGGFTKCSDSNNYRSGISMTGVVASADHTAPLTFTVKDCHTLKFITETRSNGMWVKVEVFSADGKTLLATDTSKVNTYYKYNTVRTHEASYESLLGQDVLVKVTPFVKSDSTVEAERNASICVLRKIVVE